MHAMNDFLGGLSRYLQITSLRQQLLVSNVANADTPGYRTRDIDFERSLSNALDGITESPVAISIDAQSVRPDGNDVSIDRETVAIADTEARFRLATQAVRAHFREISTAIQGDR